MCGQLACLELPSALVQVEPLAIDGCAPVPTVCSHDVQITVAIEVGHGDRLDIFLSFEQPFLFPRAVCGVLVHQGSARKIHPSVVVHVTDGRKVIVFSYRIVGRVEANLPFVGMEVHVAVIQQESFLLVAYFQVVAVDIGPSVPVEVDHIAAVADVQVGVERLHQFLERTLRVGVEPFRESFRPSVLVEVEHIAAVAVFVGFRAERDYLYALRKRVPVEREGNGFLSETLERDVGRPICVLADDASVGLQVVLVVRAFTGVNWCDMQGVRCAQLVDRSREGRADQMVFKRGLFAPRAADAVRTDGLYGNMVSAFRPRPGIKHQVGGGACITIGERAAASVGIGLRLHDVATSRGCAYSDFIRESRFLRRCFPFHPNQSGGRVHGTGRGFRGGHCGRLSVFQSVEIMFHIVGGDEEIGFSIAIQVGYERIFFVGQHVTFGEKHGPVQVEVRVPLEQIEVIL